MYIFKHHHKAFSLLELLIVIAIIATLAAAALTSYHDYVIRSTIGSLLQEAAGAKADVENSHNQGVIFGNTSTQPYVSSSDADKPFGLESITRVSYGCIDIQINLSDLNLDSSKDITMALCPNGTTDTNYISWSCGYESSTYTNYVTYLPSDCQNPVTAIQDLNF